jgi:phospho-N-acetylmuramoyl-pentapeptide-transferase
MTTGLAPIPGCPVPHFHLGLGLPVFLWILYIMPIYIKRLRLMQFGQAIREDGPQSHQGKAGTPTAGGVWIVLCSLAALVFAAIYKPFQPVITPPVVWVAIVLAVFGFLGLTDDWLKISKKKNKGVSGYTKLMVQVLIGLLFGAWMMVMPESAQGTIHVFNLASVQLGWFYPLYAAFIITGTSNAVNLTDGLDGLAAGTVFITLVALSVHLYSMTMDLSIYAAVIASAVLGFWWFNKHPAKIFMGDTGSLALGGAIGVLALASGTEWSLLFLAPVFILEALSVIIQVTGFKLTGKRVFKMAPLHHHFELCGFTEQQVVWGFTAFQLTCAALCLVLFFHF